MKKTRKILLAAMTCCTVALSACAFAACGQQQEHVHSYGMNWTRTETHHYYAATCEHSDEKIAYGLHAWGEPVVTKAATESEEGSQTLTCVVCGKTKTESIDVKGHTYSANWSADETHHYHAATCSHTSEKSGEEAHTFGEWETILKATHTSKGARSRSCTVCNYTETEEVAETAAHDYNETAWAASAATHYFACECGAKKSEENHNFTAQRGVDGTTNFNGKHILKCVGGNGKNGCNYEKVESHTYDAGVVKQEKTCDQDGIKELTCTGCGYVYTIITPAGHSYAGTWSHDETHHWHAATCSHTTEKGNYATHNFGTPVITEEGGVKTMTRTCTTCKYEKTETVTGATGYDLEAKVLNNRGSVTGNAVALEGDEIHIKPDTVTDFAFKNVQPDNEMLKAEYKQIKVYEIGKDDEKAELTSEGGVILVGIDWETRGSGKNASDVVYFRIKVTDAQSHRIRVESSQASKEFTVIPDAAKPVVQYSLDNGATWETYSAKLTLEKQSEEGVTILLATDTVCKFTGSYFNMDTFDMTFDGVIAPAEVSGKDNVVSVTLKKTGDGYIITCSGSYDYSVSMNITLTETAAS